MNRWLYFGVLIVAIGMVIYLLYSKGLAVIKSIAAILFVFRTGRDADKATLDSCTGWVIVNEIALCVLQPNRMESAATAKSKTQALNSFTISMWEDFRKAEHMSLPLMLNCQKEM